MQPQTETKPQAVPVLPELRQDLRLEASGAAADGTPMWLVVDPTQHRYIKISQSAHNLLSAWKPGSTYSELKAAVAKSFDETVSEDEIGEFIRFLSANNLTLEPLSGSWKHYSAVVAQGQHGWLAWLIHNYLFIRVPLFKPDAHLQRWLPVVRPLGTHAFFLIVLAAGATGLYLTSRQWDTFMATFENYLSFDGAIAYAIAIILVKSAHELGHAFTAARYGVRVPSMGICFLVLFPVLYTDVTDAWRLKSRRARLSIGGAGVAVELTLACFATLLWAFLPEGTLKGLAFSIATVGWVLSLAVNLNPLMRFDGYYLFSDALGIENLQTRAFALGRWRLREFLFAAGDQPPEILSAAMRRTLVLYAWLVWIYRLVLFTGIALIVYHMAFKLLGIALFLIEIVYFIIWPIAGEFRDWHARGRELMSTGRARVTMAFAAVMFFWFVTPHPTRIAVPAILETREISRVYPLRAGHVEAVRVSVGSTVKAGDVLVRLSSRELDYKLSLAKAKRALVLIRLARRNVDDEDRASSLVLAQELKSLTAEIAGFERERQELLIKSPTDGVVAELNRDVHAGRSIGRGEFIALVRSGGDLVARGYMAANDVPRVEVGAPGYFVPEDFNRSRIKVRLDVVSQAGASSVDISELASTYGGPVAVRMQHGAGGHRIMAPVEARYLVSMHADVADVPKAALRGTVHLSGTEQSPAARFFRHLSSVLVRESGI